MHVGTNYIAKVVNNITKEHYVVKVYNKSSKVNHQLEHIVIDRLSKVGLHPEVVCLDKNYRVEKFIEGAAINILQLRATPKLLHVVKLIASLHSNSQLKNQILPLIDDKRPFVLSMNDCWLHAFHELYPAIQETLKGTKYEAFGNSLNYLLSEDFRVLFKSLIPKTSQTVLSHNDVSAANLMHSKDSEMYLIDYEYCKLNFRGYDLAVLIEDITTDYDYSEYPNFKMHHELALTKKEEESLLRHYIDNTGIAMTKNELKVELKNLEREVRTLKVAFQLAGVLWGLTTHDWREGGFDEEDCWRIEYARQRWVIFVNYIKKNPYKVRVFDEVNLDF
jgi:thiamine kinase-like enzyme